MTINVPALLIGFVMGVAVSGIALVIASIIIGQRARKADRK